MTRRVAAIVLAAGGSTRFGSPKQLVSLGGEALVRRAARIAHDAGADPVFVVVGAGADNISSHINDVPGVQIIVNQNWETGLASSIRSGIEAALLDGSANGLLVTLADQTSIDTSILKELINAFDAEHRIVACSYDNVIGAPAVFGIEHARDLMRLSGDRGAGGWLRRRKEEVTLIPVPSGTGDIDTPADLANLKRSGQSFVS